MISNGPPRNYCGALKEHLIGHVLRGQYWGSTDNQLSFSYSSKIFPSNKVEIWLHHFHLGHQSFNVLKNMFHSLSRKSMLMIFIVIVVSLLNTIVLLWKSDMIWMVTCRILWERLRPQLWQILWWFVWFFFFPYLYFFHILLSVYMLNRDPIM